MSDLGASSADIDDSAILGQDVKIWHLAQIQEQAEIGDGTIISRGAYVDHGVVIGRNSKIQNYALVYSPAILGVGVFVGPAAVLTNDRFPRAVTPELELQTADDWSLGNTFGLPLTVPQKVPSKCPQALHGYTKGATGCNQIKYRNGGESGSNAKKPPLHRLCQNRLICSEEAVAFGEVSVVGNERSDQGLKILRRDLCVSGHHCRDINASSQRSSMH